GQVGQCELVVYVLQSTGAKLSHSTLLFEYSEDRLDDRLSSRVGGLAVGRSQLGAHAAMRCGACFCAAADAQIQFAGNVRVRHISVDVALFHLFDVRDGEEAAVGQNRTWRRAAALEAATFG